jgi:ABC-type antimicrobial peptide transport system permease subunit
MKTNTDRQNANPGAPGFRPPAAGSAAAPVAWSIGSLKLRWSVVFSLSWSSLKLRFTRSILTVLTIATASGFMMYLLTMAPTGDKTEGQSWALMMGLALLVSAAGVLNTMLMTVTQRYREIGTMKCLGALDSFVLLSVLIEAAILGLAGALIGVILGLLISALLALADYGSLFLTHLALNTLSLKILVVLAGGLALTTLSASFPAWVASKMPPMDAMRGEK